MPGLHLQTVTACQLRWSYMPKNQTVWRLTSFGQPMYSSNSQPLAELLPLIDACRLWDLAAHRALRKMLGHTAAVRGVSLTRDGTAAVSCSSDCTIKLWKARPALMSAALPDGQPAAQQPKRWS